MSKQDADRLLRACREHELVDCVRVLDEVGSTQDEALFFEKTVGRPAVGNPHLAVRYILEYTTCDVAMFRLPISMYCWCQMRFLNEDLVFFETRTAGTMVMKRNAKR